MCVQEKPADAMSAGFLVSVRPARYGSGAAAGFFQVLFERFTSA